MRSRRAAVAVLAAVLTSVWMCATAEATMTSGNQNPDLVVTARLVPNHPVLGDWVHYVATVTNMTDTRRKVLDTMQIQTPTFAQSGSAFGPLNPGETRTTRFRHHILTEADLGVYTLVVTGHDKNGDSTTTVSVTAS